MHAHSTSIAINPYGRLLASPTVSARFAVGDCIALIVTTVVATWAMMAVHELIPNTAAAIISGMFVSMLASTILAAVFGAVLGSIETKVPAMVAGMLGPMTICAWSLAMHVHPSFRICTARAAAIGLGLSLALIMYGHRCRVDFNEGRWRW